MILNKLKRFLISEKKNKNIHDIIIYGSLARGKDTARYIDILVIFLEGSLKERLDYIQSTKNRLKKGVDSTIDIKQILVQELFSEAFFARAGVLSEGISVFKNKPFSETLGFKSGVLFWYSLDSLSHAEKVRFNYILAGRNSSGIIKEFNGERISSGAVKIPINKSEDFESILKSNKVSYKKKNILEEI